MQTRNLESVVKESARENPFSSQALLFFAGLVIFAVIGLWLCYRWENSIDPLLPPVAEAGRSEGMTFICVGKSLYVRGNGSDLVQLFETGPYGLMTVPCPKRP